MFFRSESTLEEKAWQHEWTKARRDADVKWYTLHYERENRRLYEIFKEKIEEIFEGINIYQLFFDDELPGENINDTLRAYKEALLDELWNDLSQKNVKHVMDAARALEKVNQSVVMGFPAESQYKLFLKDTADFKKKSQHVGFKPFTKMCAGFLCSYYVGIGVFLSILLLSALAPPVLGIVAAIGLIVPIALGSRLSFIKYNPAIVADGIGEEIGEKLGAVRRLAI